MPTALEQIRKRDGRIVPFDPQLISQAIAKATQAVHGADAELAESLAASVAREVERQSDSGLATVEQIQDAIEAVLIDAGLARAAKAFILYRARRSRIREGKSELMLAVDDVLSNDGDGSPPRSPAGMLWAVGAAASQEYHLKRMLPEEEAVAHMRGDIHVEGLDTYAKAPNALNVPLDRLLDGIEPDAPPHAVVLRLLIALQTLSSELSGSLGLESIDSLLGVAFEHASEQEIASAVAELLQALGMPTWRSDAPLPLVLSFGVDPSPHARRVAFALLDALNRHSLNAPTLVMRLRPGMNLAAGDPNHDLFRAALAADRMMPRFAFGDEPVLGGGMRLAPDRFGAPTLGRSILASVTINLPRIALQARRDHQVFDAHLMRVLDLAGRHLASRMAVLGQLKARELPRLMLQGLHAGSEDLGPNDPAGFALRHGQLNVAFVGLAEALTLVHGEHHGESPAAQEYGLALVRLMRDTVEAMAERHDLNMVLSGQAADEAAVRFATLDRRDFGNLPRVTDRPAYTRSYLLPGDFTASIERRIAREADFHRFCPGGNGLLLAPLEREGLENSIRRMQSEGIGMLGVSKT